MIANLFAYYHERSQYFFSGNAKHLLLDAHVQKAQNKAVLHTAHEPCSLPLSRRHMCQMLKKFVKGDIQCVDLLNYVLEEEQVDTVMHFAAQSHVDNSFGNSLAFTVNNALGTHVLLESCRLYGKIRRFIAVSTDEVYGDSSVGKETGCNESSTLEPTNPYSAAKAGAEMMVKSYMKSYNMPCIITRGNNVYGPHVVS